MCKSVEEICGTGINCPGDCTETVAHNTMITLTATPGTGLNFAGWSGGCCSGTGTCTVTMGALKTVTATFAINAYAVRSSAGANGTINPSGVQTVNQGSVAIFTVATSAGFTAGVNGSCGGSLVGNTYTTNAITAPCSVTAFFTQITHSVTPSAGTNGSISPNAPVTVNHGATTAFTITPNAGYTAVVGGSCGIPDNTRATVTLSGVNGAALSSPASIGFLVGDVNGTRSVNSSDISGVKARSGQTTTSANFKFDVNATGAINSSDISAVKARSGLTLPPS